MTSPSSFQIRGNTNSFPVFAYAGFLPCMTVGEFNQLQMQWDVQGRFDHPPANESQLGDIIGADDGDIYLECLERK